jgi:hypothetical protein
MTRTTANLTPRLLACLIVAVVSIGLAAASAFAAADTGTWFDHKYGGNPVISPNDGTSGIDDVGTAWGYFITNGPNDYRMYYTGIDSAHDYDICLATSTDRINWTRITNGIGGTPKVINDGSCWAGPVWKEGSTYNMIYKKSSGGYKWYHVTSTDGISWGNATQCTGTIGTEASAFMKIGNTYHAWGSGGGPAKPYHFTSTDLTNWTVQNDGKPIFLAGGSNVICPDVFYNGDTSLYYAVAAVTPGGGPPDKWYGSYRMWSASDPDFQMNAKVVGDLLIGNADTMPLVPDWENGCNYDGQHFLWPGMFGQVHNSDPLYFYYSAEDTLDDVYNFSIGLINYPTVGEAIASASGAPEPSVFCLIATGAVSVAGLFLQTRLRRRHNT